MMHRVVLGDHMGSPLRGPVGMTVIRREGNRQGCPLRANICLWLAVFCGLLSCLVFCLLE